MSETQVGVLLLAAGQSRRFGSDKRQALMPDGRSLLDTSLSSIHRSGLPAMVCLPAGDSATAQKVRKLGFDVVMCNEPYVSMGKNLAAGFAAVPEAWRGALVALADMPWIQAETFALLATKLSSSTLCRPSYRQQQGHPVGFGRDYFPQLKSLRADAGARAVLADNFEHCQLVEVADPGVLLDIDRPEDMVLKSVTGLKSY